MKAISRTHTSHNMNNDYIPLVVSWPQCARLAQAQLFFPQTTVDPASKEEASVNSVKDKTVDEDNLYNSRKSVRYLGIGAQRATDRLYM